MRILSALLCFAVCALLACSHSTTLSGGTTTETTNGLTACVRYADGSLAANAIISIRPQLYLRGIDTVSTADSNDAVTSSKGMFVVGGLRAGMYRLTILTRDSLFGASISDLSLGKGANSKADTIQIDTIILEHTGSLAGFIPFDSSTSAPRVVLRLYGTDFIDTINPGTRFVYAGFAPSSYLPAVSINRLPSFSIDTVQVLAHDTAILTGAPFFNPTAFAGNKKILVNTSQSGTLLTTDVTQFPLLVRLNSTDPTDSAIFVHSPNSNYIQFFSNDSIPLQFEVEEWDTLASPKTACFWVKVPTLYANDSIQAIHLYYGIYTKPSHPTLRLFDKGYGYSAVWHLCEKSRDSLYDATGTVTLVSSFSQRQPGPALIAGGQKLNGVSQYIDGGDFNYFNGATSFTISMWVNADTFPFEMIHLTSTAGLPQELNRASLTIDSLGNIIAYGSNSDSSRSLLTAYSTSKLSTHTWYLISGIFMFASDSIVINVNGTEAPTLRSGTMGSVQGSGITTAPVKCSIGYDPLQHSGYSKGTLDEIRMFRSALSADWLKLCYTSQLP